MVAETGSVTTLPQEMLMKIFSLLSRSDLYNVLLVCRKWRMVAESPWLWRRMEVVVGQIKVTNMNLLNSTRLRLLWPRSISCSSVTPHISLEIINVSLGFLNFRSESEISRSE